MAVPDISCLSVFDSAHKKMFVLSLGRYAYLEEGPLWCKRRNLRLLMWSLNPVSLRENKEGLERELNG